MTKAFDSIKKACSKLLPMCQGNKARRLCTFPNPSMSKRSASRWG